MNRTLMTALVLGMFASAGYAQPGQRPSPGQRQSPGGQARGGGGSRPGTTGSSTLERTGLKIGQKVPGITIHDDQGGPFPMANLKGKYTVITFGCLT